MTFPQGGIFGIDLIPGIDLQDLIPTPVADAIRGTVDRILDPETDVNIGDPQPADRPIPVDAGSPQLSSAVQVIDGILTAINLILKFGLVVPDSTEAVLKKLGGALQTIRNWLT